MSALFTKLPHLYHKKDPHFFLKKKYIIHKNCSICQESLLLAPCSWHWWNNFHSPGHPTAFAWNEKGIYDVLSIYLNRYKVSHGPGNYEGFAFFFLLILLEGFWGQPPRPIFWSPWVTMLIALKQHSSTYHSPEGFIQLKTGRAQDAQLQWSQKNW